MFIFIGFHNRINKYIAYNILKFFLMVKLADDKKVPGELQDCPFYKPHFFLRDPLREYPFRVIVGFCGRHFVY